MGNLLYVFAAILIIAWTPGFFIYGMGHYIHLVLAVALIAVIVRVIRGKQII